MSLKNIGNIISSLSGGDNLKSLVDGIKELYSITSTMNVSAIGLNNVFNVFKKFNELEKGKQILKEVSLLMKSFDGSDESLVAISKAFDGISLESTKAILGISGLNKAQIETFFINAGLAPELAATTAAEISAGAGATGAAAGFKLLTASIKEALVGLATFLLTNPVGWAILAVGAIAGVVAINEKLTTSFSEAAKAADEAKESYDNTVSELESLESQLQSVNDKINELKSHGSLTLTDKQELSTLEAQSEQLKRQIELKSQLAQIQQKAVANTAVVALTTNDSKFKVSTGSTINSVTGEEMIRYKNANIIEFTTSQKKELDEVATKIDKLRQRKEKLEATGEINAGGFLGVDRGKDADEYERISAQLERLSSDETKLTNSVSENIDTIQKSYSSLFDENGKVISGNEDLVNSCDELFGLLVTSSDKAAEAQGKIDSFLSRPALSNAVQQAVELAEAQNGINLDDIIAQFPELANAASVAGIDIQDVIDTINSMAGTINFDEVKKQMQDSFTEGAGNIHIFEKMSDEWNQFVDGLNEDEIKILYGIYNSADTSGWSIEDWKVALQNAISENEEAQSSFDQLKESFEADIESLNNLVTALSESASATGLSAEAISNLKARYQDLDRYDASKLFEKTENGVHLNEQALKDLETQYESIKKQDFISTLAELTDEYDSTKSAIEQMTDSQYDAAVASGEIRPIDAILEDIDNVETLASQFDGLTSAFNKWQQAKSGGQERDSFESVAKGLDDVKNQIEQGWAGDEDVTAYLDLMLSASQRTKDAYADFEKLDQKIQGTSHSLKDYFTFEDGNLVSDGLFDFLEDVNKVFGEEYAKFDENIGWSFDFTGDKLQEVADRFGTTTEFIQLMERAMIDAGMTVELGGSQLSAMAKDIENANEKLKEFQENGTISAEIDLDIDPASMSVDEIKDKVAELNKEKATIDINTDEGKAAVQAIENEITALNNRQVILSIKEQVEGGKTIDELKKMDDTELSSTLNVDISQVEEARKQLESLDGQTADTSVVVKIDEDQFKSLTDTTRTVTVTTAGQAELQQLKDLMDSIVDKTVKVTADVKGTNEVNKLKQSIDNLSNKVVSATAVVSGLSDVRSLNSAMNNMKDKTVYAKTITQKVSEAQGTAHAQGTAFVKGNWGIKGSGIALGGETGQELVVRGSKFFTIGDDSAEFFKYQKDDIIK